MSESTDIDVKDLTSTSFGYIIAFLLPGVIALLGIGQLISPDTVAAKYFLHPESVAPSVLYLLAALATGMVIGGLRFVMVELPLCSKHKMPANAFRTLIEAGNLSYFKAVVDEHYRYHQFYGGALFALIPGLYAIVAEFWRGWGCFTRVIVIAAMLGGEFVLWFCAKDAYIKYVDRGGVIASETKTLVEGKDNLAATPSKGEGN